MKQTIILLAFLASSAAVISSCKKTAATIDNTTCAAVDAKYSTNVKNIIATKCANPGCHTANYSQGDFTTRAGVVAKLETCRTEVSSGSMPKGSSLTAAEKNALLCWLQGGGLDN